MTASVLAPSGATPVPPEELQAVDLWTFVQLRTPRFTNTDALAVVRELAVRPGENTKLLAKRLREALRHRDLHLKHSVCLEAAARLQGGSSWQRVRLESPAQLKLHSFVSTESLAATEHFDAWRDLTPRLIELCKSALAGYGSKYLEFSWREESLLVLTEGVSLRDAERAGGIPILGVSAFDHSPAWLEGARNTVEAVRRAIEVPGLALVDGVAVFDACTRWEDLTGSVGPAISHRDACNAELVLVQEDNPLMPGSGIEIARGYELACWEQIDLAFKDELAAGAEIVLGEDAWLLGKVRLVWEVSALRPGTSEIVPGISQRTLGPQELKRLLERYRLAKRLFESRLPSRRMAKPMEYLGRPKETYRANLTAIRQRMTEAGFTWDSFCVAVGLDQEQSRELPLGFLMTVAEKLGPQDPNFVFERPRREELALAGDDRMMRALMLRTEHVRYRCAPTIAEETRDKVREAVNEFNDSQHMRLLAEAGTFRSDSPLPYLVYANAGEELRQQILDLGLDLYVGVTPCLTPLDQKIPLPASIDVSPFAWGHSLFLDVYPASQGGAQ